MHAERSDTEPLSSLSDVERAVMMVLLAGEQPIWTYTELRREVAGPQGDPADGVVDAVSRLYGAGLVHVFAREFVTASRAARAMEELTI